MIACRRGFVKYEQCELNLVVWIVIEQWFAVKHSMLPARMMMLRQKLGHLASSVDWFGS